MDKLELNLKIFQAIENILAFVPEENKHIFNYYKYLESKLVLQFGIEHNDKIEFIDFKRSNLLEFIWANLQRLNSIYILILSLYILK